MEENGKTNKRFHYEVSPLLPVPSLQRMLLMEVGIFEEQKQWPGMTTAEGGREEDEFESPACVCAVNRNEQRRRPVGCHRSVFLLFLLLWYERSSSVRLPLKWRIRSERKRVRNPSHGERECVGRKWGEQIKQINRMARVPSDLLPGYFISFQLFRPPSVVPLQPLCAQMNGKWNILVAHSLHGM